MTAAACVFIFCATLLVAQERYQEHRRVMQAEHNMLHKVEARVSALERARTQEYDHAAFEELKTKVDSMRIAQGIRGAR